MILEALHRLAVDEELMSDPDYEIKPVAWLLRVDVGGKLLGIEDLRYMPEQVGRRKPNLKAKNLRVPRQPIRTSGDRAFFLCDKAEYALGWDPEADAAKRRSREKIAVRFGLFRDMVKTCLDATSDEGIQAVWTLLENIAAGKQAIPMLDECSRADLFAFVYASDVDRPVHERPAVREYWQTKRRVVAADQVADLRCLITGKPAGKPVNLPLVKKLPGGTPSGVSLVSFNAPAFESHGWHNNENAPIARDAAEAVMTALNRLLHPRFPDPHPDRMGETLSQRNIRISANTVVCFWASKRSADEFLDVFGALLNPDDSGMVGETYRSLWWGRPVRIEDPSRFYALTITGTQGRAILRDWFESSVREVVQHLAKHFGDLDVVRNTPTPKGKALPRQIPLNLLLTSLAPFGRSEDIPVPLATEFIRAALRGTRYPLAVLQKALERARAEVGKIEWGDLARRDARAALIKAVLRRNFQQELEPSMDPNNNEPGYLLGRLMAVLERLQQVALDEVNATVVDRFFGAASAAPQAVFPRLLKNARHHARKGADNPRHARTATWLDKQIDDIVARLDVQKHRQGLPYTGFLPHLDLQQQGLFVLGYHHQRHWLWMSKEDRERWGHEQNQTPVPGA